MKRPSKEERRKHLKQRTQENWENRDKGSGKGCLDISKADPRPSFFSPKNGEFYTIDIIPFVPRSSKIPGFKEGFDEYALDYWKHSRIGPGEDDFVCLAKTFKKPCPICEELDMLKRSGATKEETSQLEPRRRMIYNIIDLESKDQKIQLWEMSYHLFEKALIAAAQVGKHEVIAFSDLEEGKTIKFTARQKSLGQYSFIETTGIGFIDRAPYEESILDESYPLDEMLIVPTYEQMKNALHGLGEGDAEEEAPAPEPARRQRTVPKEEKEEAPARRSREPEPEAAPAKPAKRERPVKTPTPKEDKCPHGYIFGADCDSHDECSSCDSWEACVDEQDRLNGEK